MKWMAALFFAFGIGNALPAAARYSRADELAITNGARSNREVNFNENWKFFLGDTAVASRPDFDDNHWRTLDLPHDWSIEGRPEEANPAGNDGGYYPTGIGWYRKTFDFVPDSRRPETTLYFEGVYMNAEVFVNGHNLGIRPYGYSSFYHDITPYLKAGKNVIAVRVDNSGQKNCRWYTGSGIYRNVKLIRTPKAHFEPWGIGITTEQVNRKTQVKVEATLAIKPSRPHCFARLPTWTVTPFSHKKKPSPLKRTGQAKSNCNSLLKTPSSGVLKHRTSTG